jgi:hypothetical protein
VLQGCPADSLPQLMATQVAGALQSLLPMQVVLQTPPVPQAQGSHSVDVTVLQLPAPSQVRPGVKTSPTQVEATQVAVVP